MRFCNLLSLAFVALVLSPLNVDAQSSGLDGISAWQHAVPASY